MLKKKSLYQPAPEHIDTPTITSLPQGDTSATEPNNVPKIKQGILEAPQRGSKPLTSTMKSSAKSSKGKKPLIVCHSPATVHSQLKSSESRAEAELVTDTVQRPQAVVIHPKPDAAKNNSINKRPKSSQRARFVQSRYKQAAAEVSVVGNTPKLSSTKKSRSTSSRELSGSYSLKTPAAKDQLPGKTSTPSSRSGLSFDWNASAIEKHQNSSGGLNPMEITAVVPPESENELEDPDILYAKYLQLHLLNQMVKHNMREKAKKYPEKLTFLHEKNVENAKKIQELEKEVMQLNHQCELENQLDVQRKAMAPVVDKLRPVLNSYKVLAENLDTTRHSLPLHGAVDPDPLSLESTLDETRNLVGQINIMTRSQAPAIEKMSESARSLSKNCAEASPSVEVNLERGVSAVLQQASLVCQLETLDHWN